MEIGERFDPLAGVTAQDAEDGEITLTEENIIDNDVDTSKAGTYHVTYRVTDQNGASTEKTITVTIKEKTVDQPESPQTPEKPHTPGAPQKPAEPQTPNQPAHTAETPTAITSKNRRSDPDRRNSFYTIRYSRYICRFGLEKTEKK